MQTRCYSLRRRFVTQRFALEMRAPKKAAILERPLVDLLQQKKRARWLAENKSAIDAYNENVAKHGSFGDKLRRF